MFAALRNWPAGQLYSLPLDLFLSRTVSAPLGTFDHIQAFCIFLGHSRSGHSLMASLLDAHRHIVFSDEMRALKYIAAGFSPTTVYKLILRNSVKISSEQRARAGYRFSVPGEWQGAFEQIRVIGDKDGSWTASLALRNFRTIEALFERIPLSIRVLHLYRNPYDVISTMYRKYQTAGNAGPLQHSINYYFRRAEGVELVRSFAGNTSVLDLRHEHLVANIEGNLAEACHFLSVDAPDSYLAACKGIVFPSARTTRHEVSWSESDIAQVAERKARYDYLIDYTFE